MRVLFLSMISALILTTFGFAQQSVETKPKEQPKAYVVDANVLNAVANYIATKPYTESAKLIEALQKSLKPVDTVCKEYVNKNQEKKPEDQKQKAD